MPLEIAQRVNVDGTGNILELCAACERLTRLNYVSTAYVAGDRRGVVYEHELVLGQGFKNHYESTKFQAELWVRARMGEIPTTIYRPAIVVGDSRTGETEKFDGPYYILRTIARVAERGGPIPQMGSPRSPFNVVPVDFVVAAMAAASADEAAAGETLHLVDPEPVSAAELGRILARAYAGREPTLPVPGTAAHSVAAGAGGARLLRRRPARVDPLPQPSGPVRHPDGLRPARPPRAALPRGSRTTPRAWSGFFRAHEHDPAFVPQAVTGYACDHARTGTAAPVASPPGPAAICGLAPGIRRPQRDHGRGEDEGAADEQRALEAGGEGVGRRGVRNQQVVGPAGGDRGEDRQTERSAELLRGVQQRRGEAGLVSRDPGVRGRAHADEHRPEPE